MLKWHPQKMKEMSMKVIMMMMTYPLVLYICLLIYLVAKTRSYVKKIKITNWDLNVVDILNATPDDYDDDIDNESEANEDSENIISVADFNDFLYEAK